MTFSAVVTGLLYLAWWADQLEAETRWDQRLWTDGLAIGVIVALWALVVRARS